MTDSGAIAGAAAAVGVPLLGAVGSLIYQLGKLRQTVSDLREDIKEAAGWRRDHDAYHAGERAQWEATMLRLVAKFTSPD